MLFLLKKIFPQLFISIILEDKKNIVKASIYRGNKLISSNEKTFDKSENLLEYIKNLSKHFLFYHTALFLDAKEQGLIPSTNIQDCEHFNIRKISLQHILLNNALVYTATEHVEYYSELFEEYRGLDFLYSPFALLYYNMQKEKQPDDQILLYGFKQGHLLAIIVAKGNTILYGDFKIFEQELGLELELPSEDNQEIENNNDDTEVTLDNFNEALNNKFDLLDQENNLETLDNNDNFNLDELNQFSNDMELCRYIITSIEKFYNDDKYAGVFINGILLYSESDINISAIDFLESETFLEIKTKQINTLDLMIELMQKELK
ncbi:clan AA aspartic protease [Campylobacter jejuni]|uniref:Clan AA aspartic protease n=3 Tax=Pseudomonadati TaxID=3379134 RepID=A0A5Z2MFA9_CAMJU|nr:clan AA aspartic protease [Campylobacter jejuni]EAH4883252.1 clan AA aspartic protease [Campylobacter jejuni]EAH7685635.1 clan AA aspartic protease [Campylobacter jejuni]EAI2623841.1 clan AA aspartic protease [Campylobacter jejuni]EAI2637826.1 clan AA aspartic protease [Campylobacter jejuni]EAI6753477.1 clan AA aspartic protease [Campylobacter jejuni]